MSTATVLVATGSEVLRLDVDQGSLRPTRSLGERRPTCLAAGVRAGGRAWCGTREAGVLVSRDAGRSWEPSGLAGRRVTAVTASSSAEGRVWAGTEPSAVWRSDDGGAMWEERSGLGGLPSSPEWAFPPRPETHHVRWIACHPHRPGRLWVAIEAGALIETSDGGATWNDRVSGSPRDTHELAVHPERPDILRVAAGDGYFESHDGGSTWRTPRGGLEVAYLRSVEVDPGDPDTVVVSAASRARSAYVAGASDGRLYRRVGDGGWEQVSHGWPDPPRTIAPLLTPGPADGELWAADERGVHRSRDGGERWEPVAEFGETPDHLRGLVVLPPA